MRTIQKLSPLALLLLLLLLATSAAHAAPTKVGNGDDGSDLEGARPLTSGPVVEARQKAVALLQSLNTPGMPGLGQLLPELRGGALYLAEKDSRAVTASDQGAFHADMRGQVYARTFAEPHAPTRFFPAALKLQEDQLVALHVHEALHRALSADVREDEAKVTAITLALTSPEASHDRVLAELHRQLPASAFTGWASPTAIAAGAPSVSVNSSVSAVEAYPIPEEARIRQPSTFGYGFREFQAPTRDTAFPVRRMHTLSSFLYPFGNDRTPLGLGLEASLINHETKTAPGPLSLSGRLRLWSGRGFDVGAFVVASLNMLSAEELKSSPFGRDVYTVGLSMRKDLRYLYVENFVSYSMRGESLQRVGLIDYRHSYGGVVNASAHAGAKILKRLRVGGYGEVFLADYYRVSGGSFGFDSGRYRLISAGPELAWEDDGWSIGLGGKFLINATKDASFDYLGNIMGQGVAQGNVAATATVSF